MRITRVHIENYRAIEKLDLVFVDHAQRFRPVNVVVGPNGVGKTSILFAITQTLRGVMGYRTTDVPEPNRDDIRLPTTAQYGWTESRPEALVEVTVEFDEFERDAIPRLIQKVGLRPPPDLPDGRLTVTWKYPPGFDRDGNRLSPNSASVEPSLEYVRSWLQAKRMAIRALIERRATLDEVAPIGGFEFFPQDRNLLQRIVGTDHPTEGSVPPQHADELDDREDFERPGRHDRPVAEILEQLAEFSKNRSVPLPENLDREKHIQQLFERICHPKKYVGFLYREGAGAPILQDGSHRYPLSHAASGEQVILEYITRLTYRGSIQRSVVLIDEPEVHLHPKWIRQLYLALPQFGTDNQFIMTTHSDELRRRAAADNYLIELGSLEGE